MVAAEKGVADSFGMTLDCQNFSLGVSVFCGRCVGIGVWKWWAACLAPIFLLHSLLKNSPFAFGMTV